MYISFKFEMQTIKNQFIYKTKEKSIIITKTL